MILGIYLNLVFRSQSFKFRFISYQHEIQEIYVRSLNSNTMPYTDMLPTVNLHFCSLLGCDVNTVFHVTRAPDPTITWLLSRPLDAHSNNSQATNYAPVRPARSGHKHSSLGSLSLFEHVLIVCLFFLMRDSWVIGFYSQTLLINGPIAGLLGNSLSFSVFYQIIQHVWGKSPTRGCEFGLAHIWLVRLRWRSGVKSVRRSAFFLPLLQTAEREEDPAGVAGQVQVWRCSGQQPNGDSVWNGEEWQQHAGKGVLARSARCVSDSSIAALQAFTSTPLWQPAQTGCSAQQMLFRLSKTAA